MVGLVHPLRQPRTHHGFSFGVIAIATHFRSRSLSHGFDLHFTRDGSAAKERKQERNGMQ